MERNTPPDECKSIPQTDEPAAAGLVVLICSVPGVRITSKQFAETSERALSNAERRALGKMERPGVVIRLATRANERCEITELEPFDGTFIGKRIERDGSITPYPKVKYWRQSVAVIPATVPGLFAYLRDARTRNICLIRGTPADPARVKTRRLNERFIDAPSKLLHVDVDGIKMAWRDDPEGAIRTLLAALGEPWCSTSCVWFFSGTHGLERDAEKRWTGRISDDNVRVRLVFITDRALNESEATAFTLLAKAKVPQVDRRLALRVQVNYIARPLWVEHPNRDVLGNIPTIGRITSAREYLAVPDELTSTARWTGAQGHSSEIADHPDAEAAVRAIGTDGEIRKHQQAAVRHLLIDNPGADASFIADALRALVERHRDEITRNLAGKPWAGVYLEGVAGWMRWLREHPTALKRKTIKPENLEQAKPAEEDIFARVARVIEFARTYFNPFLYYGTQLLTGTGALTVILLAAPTGSRKSTLMRAAAVHFLAENPSYKVVILVPRHELSDEQIELLRAEHPDGNYRGAIYRGLLADNPDRPLPGGRFEKMCMRPEEAKALRDAAIDVETHLCKQGRGKKVIKCPFYPLCGFQEQKAAVAAANLIFTPHEFVVHEKPKVFGKIGWLMFDESLLDAFTFGLDKNDRQTLALDVVKSMPVPLVQDDMAQTIEGGALPDMNLRGGRDWLYRILDELELPSKSFLGAPAVGLSEIKRIANWMWKLEMGGKAKPKIRPNMTAKQVMKELKKAKNNPGIMLLATLWKLISETESEPDGRVQVLRSRDPDKGRYVRMIGMLILANGWNARTLIADATTDPDLLREIWPYLLEII